MKIISMDMKRENLSFFLNNFKSIPEKLFQNEKVQDIANYIKSQFYDKDYIILIGKSSAFNLKTEKNYCLALNKGNIDIFVYKPRVFDIPKVQKFETFTETEISDQLGNLNNIKILRSNVNENAIIKKLKLHILCYYEKYSEKLKNEPVKFETEFVKQLNIFLIQIFNEFYWNIFMSTKIGVIRRDDIDDNGVFKKEIELELDLKPFSNLTYKPKLLIFQQQGKPEPYYKGLKNKWKEGLVFIAMLYIFFNLLLCKNNNDILFCKNGPIINIFCAGIVILILVNNYIIKRLTKKKTKIN